MLPPFSTSPLTSAPRNWPLQTASPKLSSLTFSYQLVSANGGHSKALGTRGKNQPWIFIERTDTEVEAPILWPPDSKSQLIGKDSDAGRDWGQEEKQMTEDEMAGWHHWLNGWWKELTGKKSWYWERLRARGEVGNRGWNGWMASLIQ